MDEDSGKSTPKTFNQHWGWFATIYQLSKTSILTISGGKSITELNFIFVLNFLAIDKDWNNEMIKEQKKRELEMKQRVHLR